MIAALALLFGGVLSGLFRTNTAQAAEPGFQTIDGQQVYQHPVDDQRFTFTPPDPIDGAIEATTTVAHKGSISGSVVFQRGGNIMVDHNTSNPRAIPMEGVRVYAQWMQAGDTKDKGAVSPVYTTVTNSDGTFAIEMKDFTLPTGKVVKFDADPALPEGEKVKVWAVNPNDDKYTLLFSAGNGAFYPNAVVADLTAGAEWSVANDSIAKFRIKYGEKIDNTVLHKTDDAGNILADANARDPRLDGLGGGGYVKGRVAWNFTGSASAALWQTFADLSNSGDIPVPNINVYASYLSDYAVGKIHNEYKSLIGKEIRGGGAPTTWSAEDEMKMQNWIKQQIAKEGKDKWIAETATAKTGADGHFEIQFRGTYGENWDSCGTIASQVCRNLDLFGKVADDPQDGWWQKGDLLRPVKHVNLDWMFVSHEPVPGAADTTQHHLNVWANTKIYAGSQVSSYAGWATGFNVTNSSADGYLWGLYPGELVFDVFPYNVTDNPAHRGDTAKTTAYNVPTKFVENVRYEIEWESFGVDTETFKSVHKCSNIEPTATGELPSCDYTVGDDVAEDTIFTAKLYSVDPDGKRSAQPLAADSFIVKFGWDPKYDDTQAIAGVATSSAAPLFDDNSTVDIVEKVAAADLPVGKKVKPGSYVLASSFTTPADHVVNVDPDTGVVTVTFPEGTPPGAELDVPVSVEFEDGSSSRGTAKFITVQADRDKYEPSYEGKEGKPGETVTIDSPTFTDNEGNTATPANVTYGEQPGNPVPSGVTINPDGSITVEIPNGATNGQKIDVPVRVTYEDGTPDDVTATVTVRTDDDGDGYLDPLDPANPQPGDDLCPDTPSGATVDSNGCSVAPMVEQPGPITGTVGEPITEIVVKVDNPGLHTDLVCKAEGLPAGLDIVYDEAKGGCVITGTPTAEVTDQPVKITVEHKAPETDNPNTDPVVTNTTATINPAKDDDGDGVPNHLDKCPDTPSGATVDSNGCSVAPTVEQPGPITGTVGEPITEIVVKVDNPGLHTDLVCKAEGLPAGLDIVYDEAKGGCVITGTPTAEVTDQPVKITVEHKAPETDNPNTDPVVTNTTATINPVGDDDNDGVPNDKDLCPDTKPGETVNEEGCSLNDLNDPKYKPTNAVVGQATSSEAPTFDNPKTDAVETNPAPAGTTFALGAGAPANATIDSATGIITMTPTIDQADQTFNIPVVVTYPNNGGVDETTAQFNVGDTQAATTTPKWDDSKTRPGVPVVIPNTGDDLPNGSVVTVEECPAGWTCTVQNGDELVVTPPADAPAGATVTVKVKVTYPDGSEDPEDVKVTVVANPNWDDTTTRPGKDVTIPNTGGDVPADTEVTTDGPGTATLNPDGSITVTPNPDAEPGQQITVTIKDKDGRPIDEVTVTIVENPNWDDQNTRPGKDVTIPNTGGDVPEGTEVTTEGPGEATLNPDGSITVTPKPEAKPGDVIKVTITDKDGDPIDEFTVEIVPNPNWEDKETTPNKPIVIPNTGGDVPEGTEVTTEGPGEGTLNPDGSITVTPGPDAKPGDVIKVTITDKDGDPIDEITVTIVPNPNWEDKETTPGKPIDIPNTGGDVPEGSTVEVTGPGDATLKDDGTITVTPNPDAKPGDVIKVTVKDKDGNVIDEFTVKIVEPDAPVVAKADPPAKKELSFTGASVLGTLGIAGLLTGVGALLVRRRNQ